MSNKTIEQKFMDKVEMVTESGCWIWTGACNGRGYGVFGFRGKTPVAHRVSWQLFKGEIPKGLLACHICDTPACVNPNHIFLGTHKDNSQDMSRKNRCRKSTEIFKHGKVVSIKVTKVMKVGYDSLSRDEKRDLKQKIIDNIELEVHRSKFVRGMYGAIYEE